MNDRHPCFNKMVHGRLGRIHLPVAKSCNLVCGFCDRRYSCVNESRPGVTSKLVSPEEACELTLRAVSRMPELSVAGIAGPGDPLANPVQTFETMELIRKKLPHLLLCLSTNGLALPENVDEIVALGVGHVTITVNAVDPRIGGRIYMAVKKNKEIFSGEEGASLLLRQQEKGIRSLKSKGVIVKVNTVVLSGINDFHISDIAQKVSSWGVDLMNCIPLIPVPGTALADLSEPGKKQMAAIRRQAEKFLPQMRHCSRCRADAFGLLGEQGVIGNLVT